MQDTPLPQHVKNVAVLTLVWGLANGLGALVVGLLVATGVVDPSIEDSLGPVPASTVIGFAIVLTATLGLLHLLAGWALFDHRGWGRGLTMVLAVLALFNIPLGTAYGGYALWVLTREGVEETIRQPAA